MISLLNRRMPGSPTISPAVRGGWFSVAFLAVCLSSGCAALTNPLADALPVRQVPPELLGRHQDETVPISPSLLGQKTPDIYRLDRNDVLGIYLEGVLGDKTQPLPASFPERPGLTPALGYPVTVQEDGTLDMPLVPVIPVRGLSVVEAKEAIRQAYIAKGIIQPNRERLIVTLARKRNVRVTVMRQEVGNFNSTPEGFAGISLASGTTKRGSGHAIDLPAYENDVLNALARTGGMPGLDAYNELWICRNPSSRDLMALQQAFEQRKKDRKLDLTTWVECPVIRIPLRVHVGEALAIRPEDVILQQGDAIYIESRDIEVFYTGGLLPPGETVLPRDRDLNVVEAIALVKGPLVSGAFSTSNLAGTIVNPGMGNPNPSLLVVLRQLPGGGQVPIRVDLNKALRDPNERILVQAKDVLILQETPGEAITRYFTQVFSLSINSTLYQRLGSTGTTAITVP